jgi:hypothetical protein
MPRAQDLFGGGSLGGGRGSTDRGPGVKFKVGRANIPMEPLPAFETYADQIKQLQNLAGDLTDPMIEIGEYLIDYVKNRMDSGYFNDGQRSSVTKQVREARGQDPDGSYLVGEGNLRDSVKRIESSTEKKKGGAYIKNILSIGTVGIPYAFVHIDGGTWNVPGFRGPDRKDGSPGWFYPDMEAIGTGTSNSSFYSNTKPKWKTIQGYTSETYSMDIPQRDFLDWDFTMNDEVERILLEHFEKAWGAPF